MALICFSIITETSFDIKKKINITDTEYPIMLKRLDAHYDWLRSPVSTFGNKTLPVVLTNSDGCQPSSTVNGSVALVNSGGCSYFKKVTE